MKFILRLVLMVGFALAGGYLFHLPWYSNLLIASVISFVIYGNPFNVFISGFLGAGLPWMIIAWIQNSSSHKDLASKMMETISLSGDPNLLIVLTGLIAGITTGVGALTGNSLRRIFVKNKKRMKTSAY